MFGENLPGKPLLVLSLEDSTCFSCFGISFGYPLDEICQGLSNDFFGPAGISNTLSIFFLSSPSPQVCLKKSKEKLSPSGSLAGTMALSEQSCLHSGGLALWP